MARTVALGEPASWQRDLRMVAAAQLAGVAAAIPGADVEDVNARARDIIEAAATAAISSRRSATASPCGMSTKRRSSGTAGMGRLTRRVPITIEPGIHLPGMGGVSIEDTLVVRAGPESAGSAEILTTTTKELIVL